MTKIYLITGFLGAGKTTFLNQQLGSSDKQVGVLMNEFGKISMDTITVKKNGIDLLELKNGSIFCSCLKSHFIDGLIELLKMDLDEIYIESSGLSDPSNMMQVIEIIGKKSGLNDFDYMGSICLVDGVYFFDELEKMVSVERQIRHSHLIAINKVDLIDSVKLKKIEETIKKINPRAMVVNMTFGNFNLSELDMSSFHIEDQETSNRLDNKPKTLLLRFTKQPSMTQLAHFLECIVDTFFRIKGFVQVDEGLCKIDTVQNHVEIKPYKDESIEAGSVGYNELVFLTDKGLTAFSRLARTSEELISGMYELEV